MARAAPAASRAVSILGFLTAHRSRGFTISELVSHLQLNIASAHATLAVLCDAGFLIRDPVHRTYTLGPALAATGFAAVEQHPAIEAAIEQAATLAAELGVEAGVSAIAGRDVILLARRGPEPGTDTIGYPGDRSPLLAPFGAIFMAWSPEAEVDAWLARGSVDESTAAVYRQVLAEIRARGFSVPMRSFTSSTIASAVTRMREQPAESAVERRLTAALHDAGVLLAAFADVPPYSKIMFTTVAAPIFDPIGRVLLSLSVTGPDHPVALEEVFELGRRVTRAAAVATQRARGRMP